jgi:hypothetical protein
MALIRRRGWQTCSPSSPITRSRSLTNCFHGLGDLANGVRQPDHGSNDEGTTGFTSFGIENLKELIEIHKADPTIMERYRDI